MRGLYVRDDEIQDRARVIEVRPFRTAQHEAHAATIEESQLSGRE